MAFNEVKHILTRKLNAIKLEEKEGKIL